MSASLSVPAWNPPYAVRGDSQLVRVSASDLGSELQWSCPEQLAFKARPAVFLDVPYRDTPRPEFESFAIGLVRDVMLRSLGAVDVPGATMSPSDALTALTKDRNWAVESLAAVKAGVNGYFEVLRRLRADPDWADAKFASSLVMADEDSGTRIEWFAWGVHVVRSAQSVRETHLLRWRGDARGIAPARIATAARNAALGFFPTGGSWSAPFQAMPQQPALPERVIIRVVGLLDATDVVLFDGTPADAAERFAAAVPGQLARFGGGGGNPGGRCAGCRVFELCPHPLRSPGVLGVAGRATRLTPLSPADVSMHRSCPERYHLSRTLGLPPQAQERGAAVVRGTLVHAWLAAAHDRRLQCSPEDLPGDQARDVGPIASALGWTESDYALARPLLLQHLDGCPFATGSVTEVSSEHPLSVVDTDTNVVFSTRFDFAAADAVAGVVVRETKTINPRQLPDDEGELIDLFPQVAFPIVALAAGINPMTASVEDRPVAGRVELELLNDGYGTVITFDVADPDVVLAARVAIAEHVDVLIHDREHVPVPGPQCRWCPVGQWCPARSEVEVGLSETLSFEADPTEPVPGTLELIARAVAATDGADEDVPF